MGQNGCDNEWSAPRSRMSILQKHNINIVGNGSRTMLLAHGYGCDQIMWRFLVPAFEDEYRIVLFDHVGAGKSDVSQYSRERYGTLQGYADDVLDIIDAVSGAPVIFVGHSVSSIIGVLAANKRPGAFERLVLVGPSPCYLNNDGYIGGFTKPDIYGLLQTLDENHLGWSRAIAPVDYEERRQAGTGVRACRELLPYGPGDCKALRPGNVSFR